MWQSDSQWEKIQVSLLRPTVLNLWVMTHLGDQSTLTVVAYNISVYQFLTL